jgi:predicted CXXCH cytochrome family protein
MRKLVTIFSLTALIIFTFTASAFALNYTTTFTPTHYGFAEYSEACASCHVTHSASAASLLLYGDTQTAFCYLCHGETSGGSPYDVEKGVITGNDAVDRASTSGAFDFDSLDYDGTSRHDVEDTITPGSDLASVAIPGNSTTNGLVGGLRCVSCHDPHAGDASNSRLLRTVIWSGQTAVNTVDFVYDPDQLLVTDYKNTAINDYCSLCHGKFNVSNDGAKILNNGKYRHAMGVRVAAGSTTLPLANTQPTDNPGENLLVCLTCHVAHGTDAVMNYTYATWNRDAGSSPATGTGSVLLRMSERDVCYNCHDAAAKNLEATGD